MSKIAFLFLTIGDVSHPKLWEDYFLECPQKASIYVHPKYPKQVSLEWMTKNIISKLVPTRWGYLTQAFYQLLQQAYQNSQNKHFIFISDSCIPITKLSVFWEFVSSFPLRTSFIHFKEGIDQYDWDKKIKKQPGFDNYSLRKHEGLGNCLSRYHVSQLLKRKSDFTRFFNKLNCGDEFYLSLLKEDKFIHDQQMTSYNWEEGRQKISLINSEMDQIYQQAERNHINKIKKKLHSLKRKGGSHSAINRLKKSLKRIGHLDNQHLLSKKQLNKLKELRIKKSILGKHPKEYQQISAVEIETLKKEGYFFIRKVKQEAILNFLN